MLLSKGHAILGDGQMVTGGSVNRGWELDGQGTEKDGLLIMVGII